MDATRFIAFIAVVFAGGLLMAVILELLNTERHEEARERRREVEPGVRSVATLPAFFARPAADVPGPAVTGFDEALLALIEEHVRSERAIVTQFVHFPSLDSLYRQARPSPTLN